MWTDNVKNIISAKKAKRDTEINNQEIFEEQIYGLFEMIEQNIKRGYYKMFIEKNPTVTERNSLADIIINNQNNIIETLEDLGYEITIYDGLSRIKISWK